MNHGISWLEMITRKETNIKARLGKTYTLFTSMRYSLVYMDMKSGIYFFFLSQPLFLLSFFLLNYSMTFLAWEFKMHIL